MDTPGLILFAGALLLTSPPCSQVPESDSPPPVQRGVQSTAEGKEILKAYRKRFALVVGIDDYRAGIRRLKYAAKDAQAIHDLLENHFGFDVNLLLNEKAKREGILAAIVKLRRQMQYDDQFLFYFAGHGVTFGNGAQEIGFLLPQDVGGSDESSVAVSAISMNDLRDRIVRLPAKHALLLVDACFGGYAARTSRSIPRSTRDYIFNITRRRAREIITAGKRDEMVYESDEWRHSAFTYTLLRGLDGGFADGDGNGIVIATELFSYLSSAVSTLTGGAQTPQYGELLPEEGENVFVLPSGIRPRFEADEIGSVQDRGRDDPRIASVLSSVRDAESYCAAGGPNSGKGVEMFLRIVEDLPPEIYAQLDEPDPNYLEQAEAEVRAGSRDSACSNYSAWFRPLLQENPEHRIGDRP